MKMCFNRLFARALVLRLVLFAIAATGAENPSLRVLFLGDNDHHKPADRFKQLQPVLGKKGIDLVYTDSMADLNPATLAGYDCIMIYANQTRIEPAQERALLDFVEHGGGLAAIHCASYCFLNSPKYVELVGAQFKSHETGVFREILVNTNHPVTRGLQPIESWDETYVHTKHNTNRVVLAERRDNKGAEPWTWVREHGKGRVFYTAWGHDQRTWSNAGFEALVENGIRWASANSPTQLKPHAGLKPFEYVKAPDKLPNYTPGAKWGTQGEPLDTMQAPLSPTESMRHLVTFPEFSVNLFASEPDIVKPIWMAWDARGRLWIAETIDYPNSMRPEGEGHDRLKICEDTDGDGRADKFTIFADKLSIPTGFVFANGGVIVIHSGKTEFLKDTDGDDKADVRKVLFSGWGTNDTHATASNLRYGFDNWIWGVVGYSGFQGTVGGKPIRFGQGIYRFKADGSALEFVRSSNNNTWGLGITEDNLIFGSTANGNASMYMPIPNRNYEAVNGWSAARLETIADSQRFFPITDKVRQVDYHGRYTAGAGSAIYTARNFPREYWNRAQFVAEPTGHLLGRFFLEPHGADFVAHNARNFAASDDEWTGPICAEVGPDGALWMIDWYNYIIQHNPTPQGFRTGTGAAYETPLRDKTHGRIYRIAYNQAKAAPQLNLEVASPEQLVFALKNDNMLWRMHAQRLLIEHQDLSVVPQLCGLVNDRGTDDLGLNPPAIHALWTLHELGVLNGSNPQAAQAVTAALHHPSSGVRRATVNVLSRDASGLRALLDARLLEDSDPQVRMAALLAFAEMPADNAAAGGILAMLQQVANVSDRWIADAGICAAARNDEAFIRQLVVTIKSAANVAGPSGNVLPNSSFEEQSNSLPAKWHTVTYSGRGDFSLAGIGHNGNHSVRITSELGGDLSWSAQAQVQPRTVYKLTGWIKTEKVKKLGSAHGAMFNVHEVQDAGRGGTPALVDDNDWTQVQLEFNTGDLTQVTINCLLGGWGVASGTAWYDDVELTPASAPELPGEVGRVTRLVTRHYAQRGPVDSIVPVVATLKGASPALADTILDGLVAGWPREKTPSLSETQKQSMQELMAALPESARDRLLALAQRWGRPEIFADSIGPILASLKEKVGAPATRDDARIAAAKQLINLQDKHDNAEIVLAQVTLLTPPELAAGLLSALGESRNPETARAIVEHWSQYSPAIRRAAIALLLRRSEWAMTLLDVIEKASISRTDLATEHWSQLKENANPAVARRAAELSGAKAGVSADRKEIVEKLLPLANEKGDPARGKEVFATTCAVCHTFNGQGGKVGPDLSGVGARDRSEILVDILDPNRSVEANYRMWSVTTKDDESFSGRLETETQTSVEILDTTGQKHVIQRKDIAAMTGSQLSIMPVGFESLPGTDLKSLLEYLTQTK